MARVKGGAVSKNRRRKVLKQAKGYFEVNIDFIKQLKNNYSIVVLMHLETVNKIRETLENFGLQELMQRCRENDISYSKFINGLNKAGIEINRKMLSELAIDDPKSFTALVVTAKKALLGEEIKAEVKETVKEVKKKLKR